MNDIKNLPLNFKVFLIRSLLLFSSRTLDDKQNKRSECHFILALFLLIPFHLRDNVKSREGY